MIGFLLGNWQRFAVYAALIALVLGMAELDGYRRGEKKLWEYQAEQARAVVPIVIKQGVVTERTVTKYRDRIVKVKGETVTLTKEIPVYVPPAADVVLPAGWVMLHDAAATRTVPESADGVDVAAPAVAASQAIQGVIANYGQCYETAIQLLILQEWIRYQYETMNQQPLGY